jgi:folate-dependent phosphoribosylglycinamide formyltransferase PurN
MRVGWFSSGRGPGSQALLAAACDAIESGDLPVEIAYLFCNRERGEHPPADELMDLAESHDIPVVTLSSSLYRREIGGAVARAGQPLPEWRTAYDSAVLAMLRPFETKTAVLAGYQLIAPELCRHLSLINLHPAAPGGPVGLWQEVIWQLIENSALTSGITIFLATPELDAGPAISYCTYVIRDEEDEQEWRQAESIPFNSLREQEGEQTPLFVEIRRRGAIREVPLLLATLAALARDEVRIDAGQVVNAAGSPMKPLDLSDQVDRLVEAEL